MVDCSMVNLSEIVFFGGFKVDHKGSSQMVVTFHFVSHKLYLLTLHEIFGQLFELLFLLDVCEFDARQFLLD